jgi:hypothetical protein
VIEWDKTIHQRQDRRRTDRMSPAYLRWGIEIDFENHMARLIKRHIVFKHPSMGVA